MIESIHALGTILYVFGISRQEPYLYGNLLQTAKCLNKVTFANYARDFTLFDDKVICGGLDGNLKLFDSDVS